MLTVSGKCLTLLAGASIALLAWAPSAHADGAALLFDPTRVAEIDLSIPAASRAALEQDPDEYQDATLSLQASGETRGPLEVGIRLKGSASFRPLTGKAAFKVRFDEQFLGLKRLTLNNMVQDPSMLHESLTYELLREAGVAAPRTGYAYVRVDGEDFGLYANIETPDRFMLPRWFDSTRHLYEGNPGADVTAAGRERFEVDEGDEDDLSDLDALIVAAAGPGDFSERLEPVAELDQMTALWAIQKYLGQWDGYAAAPGYGPNNYYLHGDAGGRFRMLPWGMDQTFDAHIPFVGDQGALFTGCLADPSCAAAYRAKLFALPALVAGLRLDAEAEATAALLAPWQALDPRREQSLTEIAAGVAATRRFIAERPADLTDAALWSGPPRSGGPDPPLDPVAPETRITGGPDAVVGSRGRRRAIRIRFASTAPGARFECRLGKAAYARCVSPARVRVGIGRHRFRVRAIDAAGNADPTPAQHSWRVRRGGRAAR